MDNNFHLLPILSWTPPIGHGDATVDGGDPGNGPQVRPGHDLIPVFGGVRVQVVQLVDDVSQAGVGVVPKFNAAIAAAHTVVEGCEWEKRAQQSPISLVLFFTVHVLTNSCGN